MNGKYKGESSVLLFIAIILLLVYADVFMVFIEPRVESAAGTAVSLIPTLFGFIAAAFSDRLPCRFTADEKSLTIITGWIKHRYLLSEISAVDCKCRRHTESKTSVILNITKMNGKNVCYKEIHREDHKELKYGRNAEKPQLEQLCEYIQSVK